MTSASSDVDFDDYGVFGYQLEPEYTEEELKTNGRGSECPTLGNQEQPTSERHKFDIHLDKVRKRSWSWAV